MTTQPAKRVGHTDIGGDLGGRVASRLAARGVEVADGSAGAEVLFLVPVRERADRVAVHAAAVDAAAAAGVRHIVYLSFLNTGPAATFTLARDHFATEQRIRATGVDFTFVRASAFLEVAHFLIGPDDVIRGPAGSGRVAFVGKDDVAEVVTAVLLDPAEHAGTTFELTGPRAVSLSELALAFTEAAGRPITYVEESVDEAYASRAAPDVPAWLLDAWVSTYLQIAAGELDMVTGDVELILGRRPTSLEAYLVAHPDVVRPTS